MISHLSTNFIDNSIALTLINATTTQYTIHYLFSLSSSLIFSLIFFLLMLLVIDYNCCRDYLMSTIAAMSGSKRNMRENDIEK